jgi:hypothetical protein
MQFQQHSQVVCMIGAHIRRYLKINLEGAIKYCLCLLTPWVCMIEVSIDFKVSREEVYKCVKTI